MDEFEQRLPNLNHYANAVVKRCEEPRRLCLLPQQITALHDVKKFFALGSSQNEAALVSMPTGSGKTGVIACLPYYLANIPISRECNDPRYLFNKPILLIAPGLDILNQLIKELAVNVNDSPFLIRTGIVPLEIQREVLPKLLIIQQTSELSNQEYLRTADIVIANAQKFLAGQWENVLSDDLFRLVIVDEAHHHPAATWSRIVEKFRNPDCPVVFFTATPYRTDKQPVLPPEYIAHHLKLNDAVAQRIIRPTKFEELSEIQPGDSFLRNPEAFTEAQKNDIRRMIPILDRVHELLEEKRSTTPPNVPHVAIAIAKDTSYADLLLDLWRSLHSNEPAETYYSDKKKDEKTAIMEKLVNNKLSLVIIVAMLLEGFDHPPISIAAITYRIKSPVRFVQFIGRAQRIYRKAGYTDELSANIVTHEYYEQHQNYTNFKTEALIPRTDDENVDEN